MAASFTTITAGTSILPDTSGGADIGTADLEFGDVFIADNKAIKFGSGQDVLAKFDTTSSTLQISNGDVSIADDKKLFFGTDKDVSIEYDEDGNNTMLITGDVVFADGSTSVDIKSHDLSANGLKLDGTLVTASATELNILDGVTRTTSQINSARDGTVTSVGATDPIQSSGGTTPTISIKNDFIQNTSSAIDTGTTFSFTASTYPTMISARTTSTGNPSWTITIGGSATSHTTADGDSGTVDSIQFLLPVGGTLACSTSFTYFAFQLRPG